MPSGRIRGVLRCTSISRVEERLPEASLGREVALLLGEILVSSMLVGDESGLLNRSGGCERPPVPPPTSC